MTNIFARFIKDESGATAIEYGLIAALIALAIMVGAGAVGTSLGKKFNDIATQAEHRRQLTARDTSRSIKKAVPSGAAFCFDLLNERSNLHR